jgi:hypothetical protein
MTSNLDVDISDGVLSWKENGKKVSLNIAEASQAVGDNGRELVFVLVGNDNDKTLEVYSSSGDQIATIYAPESFSFSYLIKHPEVGTAVVAGSNQKVDGWYDWHFGYDEKKNVIFRHCPSY